MAEPDNRLGHLWPADWSTGWIGYDAVDVSGAPKQGHLELSFDLERNSSPGTHRLVTGGVMVVPLVDGHPYAEGVQVNDAGRYVIEFGRTDDPNILPGDNWVVLTERFKGGGGRTMRFKLTADHTMDEPAWPTDDPEAIITQPGVTIEGLWVVEHEADGIPVGAQTGQPILFLDTRRFGRVGE